MNKKFYDWHKLQQDYQGWDMIPPDRLILDKVLEHKLTVNLDYCHQSLRQMLKPMEASTPDLYVITDLELSKQPLPELFDLYRRCYDKSRKGIYIAALSYYLVPGTLDKSLPEVYSQAVDVVFRKALGYADRIENLTTMIDDPITVGMQEGVLREGVNFIFVHPNIKFFAWKEQ